MVSVSPSKPVAPFPSDVEKGFCLRSHIAPRLDVHTTVRLAPSLVAALPETFLNILKTPTSALLNGRFEQPAGKKQAFSDLQLYL